MNLCGFQFFRFLQIVAKPGTAITFLVTVFRHIFLLVSLLPLSATAQSLDELIRKGSVPAAPSSPYERKVLYSRLVQGENELSIFLSRRKVGTRTPIHTHSSIAISCLLDGAETFYVENAKPIRVVAPNCFAMPSNVRMLSVMTGERDTYYYSIFSGPKGFSYWNVREPNVPKEMLGDFERFEHQH